MFLDYFNFHNYSAAELDAMNFIFAFLLCLIVTYYGWKAKLETDINPAIINVAVIIFIFADIIYESYNFSLQIITAKLLFTLFCCFFWVKFLNKIFK